MNMSYAFLDCNFLVFLMSFESDNGRGWRDDELLPDLAVDEGGCVIQVMTRPWKSSDEVHSRLGMSAAARTRLLPARSLQSKFITSSSSCI